MGKEWINCEKREWRLLEASAGCDTVQYVRGNFAREVVENVHCGGSAQLSVSVICVNVRLRNLR